jgi:hypothetical protein
MAEKKVNTNQVITESNSVLTVLQDLFILEGLKAGMKGKDIRKILQIDQWRVTNISKSLKTEQNRSKQEENE